jgi:hypothetical protein
MDKVERLAAAGLVRVETLPEAYRSVVEEMSDEEIETLVSVKRRIESAADVQAHTGETTPPPPEDVFGAF